MEWILAVWCGVSVTSQPKYAQPLPAIPWRKDYDAARAEAAAKKMPMAIVCFQPVSAWCDRFEEKSLKSPEVATLLAGRFIPLKVDGSKDFALTQTLKIEIYPTIVCATWDGKIIPPDLIGGWGPDVVVPHLRKVLATIAESNK